MFKIIHLQTQKEHEIKGPTKVGRAKADIIFADDKKVSKEHCLVDVLDQQLIIKDLNSSNGTYINGDKITAFENVELKDGDHLQIGQQEFKVRLQVKGQDKYGEGAQVTWFQEEIERPIGDYYRDPQALSLILTGFIYPALYLLLNARYLFHNWNFHLLPFLIVVLVSLIPPSLLLKPVAILTSFYNSKGQNSLVLFMSTWLAFLLMMQHALVTTTFQMSRVDESLRAEAIRLRCLEKAEADGCTAVVFKCPACMANLSVEENQQIGELLGWKISQPPQAPAVPPTAPVSVPQQAVVPQPEPVRVPTAQPEPPPPIAPAPPPNPSGLPNGTKVLKPISPKRNPKFSGINKKSPTRLPAKTKQRSR